LYHLDLAGLRGVFAARGRSATRPIVARTVWLLGLVSALTDVSSEMVSSILPVYLFVHLQLSPIQFGLVDGAYQGATALARVIAGVAADRWRRYKVVAAVGYALSAVCKLALIAVGGRWIALALVIAADRVGKGIRTGPRDALISLATPRPYLATAFGVHRALDTSGVVIGPLVAFVLLQWVPGRFDAIFALSFAIAIVGLSVLVLFVNDASRSNTLASEPPRESGGLFTSLAAAPFNAIAIAATLGSFTVLSDAFVYLLLQWRTGVSTGTIPLLYVGTALAYLALAVPLGRCADRIGRARMFVAGQFAVLTIYVSVAWVGVSALGLLGCLLLHGAYYAATDGVLAALVSGVTPSTMRASHLSALATATSGARMAGSVAAGFLWAWRGPHIVAVAALLGVTVSIVCSAIVLRGADADRVNAEAW
jgi:MFS family permease